MSSLPFNKCTGGGSLCVSGCDSPSCPSPDGCKLVHKSCNSFSSRSAGFPWRFSGLLPVAWLLRFLVNCLALCSGLPFVQAPCGSCCPGTCHVPLVNRSKATDLQQASPYLNGTEAAWCHKTQGHRVNLCRQPEVIFLSCLVQ